MNTQSDLDAARSYEEMNADKSTSLRWSPLEKYVGETEERLNNLQIAVHECNKRVALIHESVVTKEKIIEARTRICSDRVFLIEAAAGRKDDVYNAIESLFESSQRTSERLTVLENSLADIKDQVLLHGFDSGKNKPCYEHEGKRRPCHLDACNPTKLQKGKRSAVPPSQILKHIYDELYDSISLPGVRFVGQGKHWMHRYLWVILHMTTFAISFNYIKEAYDTWQNSPVVMSFNNSLTRVADIPFPAVTICSLPSVSNDYNITQHVSKCFSCTNDSADSCQLTDECSDSDVFALVSAVILCRCKTEITPDQWKRINDTFNDNITGVDQFSSEIKKKILPSCDRHHLGMGRHLDEFSCEQTHTLLMGFHDTPVCLTFNSLCSSDIYWDHVVPATIDERKCKKIESNLTWNTDTMMDFDKSENPIPLYREEEFEIIFTKPKNFRLESCNNGNDANSKIGLHHPGEVPLEENTRFYNFRTERHISIHVDPTLITSQKNLAHYEPSQRGCFFSHERNLTLFKYYTQKNCQMECKVNCSMVTCGCVPIYLPRPNSSVNICYKSREYICVEHNITDIQRNMSSVTYPACFCNCLPDCTSLRYDFSIDDVDIDPSERGHNHTVITIKYKQKEFPSSIRYELRSLADFVADSGGFLGVFNGFSFMVVFELFYFLTVRLWSSIKKNWRLAAENEASAENKIQENYEHSSNQTEII